MSNEPSNLDIPKKPAARRAWIKFVVEARGLTLARIAVQEGVSPQAMSYAALGAGSAHLQEALASEIGVPAAILFPEHYDQAGKRLGKVRQVQRTRARLGCHDQKASPVLTCPDAKVTLGT